MRLLRFVGLSSLSLAACSIAAASIAPADVEETPEARESPPSATALPGPEPPAPAEPAAPVKPETTTSTAAPDLRPRPVRQWDHIAKAAGEDCRTLLAQTSAKFQPLKDRATPDRKGCGIPHGVLLTRGPTGIRYSPPLSIDCSLAIRLLDVERIIQEEAELHLGAPIHTITSLGSYACRGVVGRLRGWTGGISEHAFGNALDLSRFSPKKGPPVSVLGGYEPDAEDPKSAGGRFLRAVQRRVRRDAGLRVLGPDFDASHRDHLHLDAGSPWWK